MTSEHPRRILALRTRTRLLGTLNLAIAIGGRSTGWGRDPDTFAPGRPRRTFIGHHRRATAPYHRAIELILLTGTHHHERTLIRIPLGSGPATTRPTP